MLSLCSALGCSTSADVLAKAAIKHSRALYCISLLAPILASVAAQRHRTCRASPQQNIAEGPVQLTGGFHSGSGAASIRGLRAAGRRAGTAAGHRASLLHLELGDA